MASVSSSREPVSSSDATSTTTTSSEATTTDETVPLCRALTDDEVSTCLLCKQQTNDQILLGDRLEVDTPASSVHYYCLLSACNLYQKKGADEELRGFTRGSVKAEARRTAREVCLFCGKKGAVVGCCIKRCRKMFHFPCGQANGCRTRFTGLYDSYCPDHSVFQDIPRQDPKDTCGVCAEDFARERLFLCTCCSTVLHLRCLRSFVFNAGAYQLKCPFCQNVEDFNTQVLEYSGIYVPEREPTYEDHDRMNFELICCAEGCPDPDKCVDDEDWRLTMCLLCGSCAMHLMCLRRLNFEKFQCPDCGDAEESERRFRAGVKIGDTVGHAFRFQLNLLTHTGYCVSLTSGKRKQATDLSSIKSSVRAREKETAESSVQEIKATLDPLVDRTTGALRAFLEERITISYADVPDSDVEGEMESEKPSQRSSEPNAQRRDTPARKRAEKRETAVRSKPKGSRQDESTDESEPPFKKTTAKKEASKPRQVLDSARKKKELPVKRPKRRERANVKYDEKSPQSDVDSNDAMEITIPSPVRCSPRKHPASPKQIINSHQEVGIPHEPEMRRQPPKVQNRVESVPRVTHGLPPVPPAILNLPSAKRPMRSKPQTVIINSNNNNLSTSKPTTTPQSHSDDDLVCLDDLPVKVDHSSLSRLTQPRSSMCERHKSNTTVLSPLTLNATSPGGDTVSTRRRKVWQIGASPLPGKDSTPNGSWSTQNLGWGLR